MKQEVEYTKQEIKRFNFQERMRLLWCVVIPVISSLVLIGYLGYLALNFTMNRFWNGITEEESQATFEKFISNGTK